MPNMVTSLEGQATPTQSQARMRASQPQGRGCTLTWEDLVKINQGVLTSEKVAQEFLEEEGYMPADAQGCEMEATMCM